MSNQSQVPAPTRHRRLGSAVVMGLGGLIVSVAAGLTSAGCGGPSRPVLTEAQLQERSEADGKEMMSLLRDTVGKVIASVERKAGAPGGEPATLHILALSGGGDYGAFGAGFLVGWGAASDPASRRPDFDAVTGVSTGALLAPFAFLGTDEACRTVEAFYRDPKDDWVRERSLLFFLPSNPSFMTIPGLERDIKGVFDAEFVAQMAKRSEEGRLLAISATDLDLGRQRFWDLGVEAEAAVKSGNLDRVHKILFASAAIPAIFPPIEIGESVYGDGGVTANVFLRLDPRNPHAFLPRWKAKHPDKPLPKVRYWVVINNQMTHVPKTVQPKWPAVMSPSLAAAIRSATIAEVRWLAAEVDYVNARYGTDIEVRVVAIPDDWRPPVPGDFKTETMVSLSDLGRKLGADPDSWKVWAAPERDAK